MYENHYVYLEGRCGHNGPHATHESARTDAMNKLRGCRHMRRIDIVDRTTDCTIDTICKTAAMQPEYHI